MTLRRFLGSIGAVVCLSSPLLMAVQAGAQEVLRMDAIDCTAERSQAAELRVQNLSEQARQSLEVDSLAQAARRLTQFYPAVAGVPSLQMRVALLENVLVTVDPNASLADQLVSRAVATNQAEAVVGMLPAATRAAQALPSGYSAAKTRMLTAIARYYAQLGDVQQSRITLAEALRATLTIQGAAFQANAQTDIAAAYLAAGEPQSAAALLDQALRNAQQVNNPDPYRRSAPFERIAILYAQAGQPDRALAAARQIENAPYYQSTATQAIAEHYVEAGRLDEAAELAAAIEVADLKAPTLAAIAGRYFSQGQTDRAAALFAQAQSVAQTSENGSSAFANAAVSYAEFGDLSAALEAVRTIADPAVKAPALGSIALLYARADQSDQADAIWAEALQQLGTIEDIGNQSGARQQLIDRATQLGRYDFAVRVAQTVQAGEELMFDQIELLRQLQVQAARAQRFDAVLQIAEAIPARFADERNHALLRAIVGYAKTGDVEAAQAAAANVTPQTPAQVQAMAAIAGAQAAAGQTQQAAALLTEAEQVAAGLELAEAKAEAFAAIAAAHTQAQQPQAAEAALDKAIAAAETIQDTSVRSYTLRTIAENLLLQQHDATALQIASAIPTGSERISMLNQVAELALKAGHTDRVLQAIVHLDDRASETRWLLALVDRQIAEGQPAAPLLAQALQTARQIEGEESRVIVLRADYDEQGNVIGQTTVDDDFDRGSFLEAIALRYAQIGEAGQALAVAESLQGRDLRDRVVQRVRCYG